jgi:predicted nucleic acid-binding protein
MTLTFVDSGVLIAGFRGTHAASAAAMAILGDPNRQFVSSDFVRLEVLPKPEFLKRHAETAFYQAFFDVTHLWVLSTPVLIRRALELASAHGLAAMDALHVAAAQFANVDELVTTEQPSKPMFRVSSPHVLSIHP